MIYLISNLILVSSLLYKKLNIYDSIGTICVWWNNISGKEIPENKTNENK